MPWRTCLRGGVLRAWLGEMSREVSTYDSGCFRNIRSYWRGLAPTLGRAGVDVAERSWGRVQRDPLVLLEKGIKGICKSPSLH